MKKFGAGLTNTQMTLARQIEAAGLASISQVVKAFERGEVEKIAAWKAALEPKQEAPLAEPTTSPEPQEAESVEQSPEADESASANEAEPMAWTETRSGYLSVETFASKSAAVAASFGLNVPTDAFQDEDGWHIFSRWNPTRQRTGGARPGSGRKPGSGKADQREPLYQAGYQAGRQAKRRGEAKDPSVFCSWCGERYESGHRKDCRSPMAPSWPPEEEEEV